MTIRVVARIRPSQSHELSKDVIVTPGSSTPSAPSNLVKIPNPKNASEDFSFAFTSVYGAEATQQEVFDNEIAPTVKHLFGGFDITIFAYGVTGTGKTHTMRGGKSLAERGVIPRLLSGIYRKSRKLAKDSDGHTSVELTLSYYEIYNDKVYDLLEAPEKRTIAGLPLRDNGGKTIVVGLTERSCESLKEFEKLYDEANVNRSTSATKLNAHSSRSHAILRINLAVTAGDETRISTASAIDLAGSEDNRRTENGKERLVESASINKSLFVLAKCVEAIGQKHRAPYRESKMTRILSLGQNNGMTVMILNLAPVRSYHLDTLSSLNFANRTKKIEVREVENEPVFKGCPRAVPSFSGTSIQRQPLRPLASTVHNAAVHAPNSLKQAGKLADKPTKAFSVYSDRTRLSNSSARSRPSDIPKRSTPIKRSSDAVTASALRPAKRRSPVRPNPMPRPRSKEVVSNESLDEIIEKKVTDILAARALDQPSVAPQPEISEEVQRRLELLEQKIEGRDDGREQGLTFLLMAKQHAVRGEDMSALRMYTLAKEYFPDNAKLDTKIQRLRKKLDEKKSQQQKIQPATLPEESFDPQAAPSRVPTKATQTVSEDDDYRDAAGPGNDAVYDSAGSFKYRSKAKKKSKSQPAKSTLRVFNDPSDFNPAPTPRTKELLEIVNTRDVAQIRLLKGVGSKKAEAILEALCAGEEDEDELQARRVNSLAELGRLKGVGAKTVDNMRCGLRSSAVR